MASVPSEFFVPTLDIDLAWQYVGFPLLGLRVEDRAIYPALISSTRKDTLVAVSNTQSGSLTSMSFLVVVRSFGDGI